MRHDVVDRGGRGVAAPDRLDAPSLLDLAAVDDVDGEAPEYFRDVSLDRIVERMLAGLSEYRLEPVLYRTLSSPAAVVFRQEIFRDLHGRPLSGAMHAFAGRMRTVRRALEQARVLRLDLQRQGAFLSAVRTYCAAVATLAHDLADADLRSAGLSRTRAYVDGYLASPGFARLDLESSRVEHALAEIVYCLEVGRDHVRVTPFEGQADYAEKVEQTFARFRAGGPRPVAATRDAAADMNMLETAVLRMVARLFPGPFAALAAFSERHRDVVDPGLCEIERQAAFYLAWLDVMRPLEQAGLPFCYPIVSSSKEIRVESGYDLALATQAVSQGRSVVGNDISLRHEERVLVVTGPNQGGKTTFARMFAQLHHLAALGCPVPARSARLLLPDRILTHFDRQEDLSDLRGKLEDDLVRIRDLLRRATPNTLVVANELFASTSPADALELGGRIIQEMIARDLVAVYVTFVDELAALAPQVVSLTATVSPLDPGVRTFQVVRRQADGRAYATAVAQKYRLDRATLKERLAR